MLVLSQITLGSGLLLGRAVEDAEHARLLLQLLLLLLHLLVERVEGIVAELGQLLADIGHFGAREA